MTETEIKYTNGCPFDRCAVRMSPHCHTFLLKNGEWEPMPYTLIDDLESEMVKRCNEFIYGFMYPTAMSLERGQLRDLVRTFYAGALEILIISGDVETSLKLLEIIKPMTPENWWPDSRFERHE